MKLFSSPLSPMERRAWYITIFLTIPFIVVFLAVAALLHRFISPSTVAEVLPLVVLIFAWQTFSYVVKVLEKNK